MTEDQTNTELSNRRHGPDLWLRLLSWLNLCCWILLSGALALAHLAEPDFNSGLVRYWKIPVDPYWDQALLAYSTPLFIACLLLSLISLVLHWRRNRRHTDSVRLNLYLLVLFSAVAIWLLSGLSTR
ncbi:hypothetical protein [Rheinheimera sp.]|uniref:hypothetical protein n=1 Tax=Rheinheimera sp. TaxID=1869214 RepID=UPI00307F5DCF